MSTLVKTKDRAFYADGYIHICMDGGLELSFPVAKNPRLAKGTPEQLNNITLTPFGIHWPDLDEDLSKAGLVEGDFGQFQRVL